MPMNLAELRLRIAAYKKERAGMAPTFKWADANGPIGMAELNWVVDVLETQEARIGRLERWLEEKESK